MVDEKEQTVAFSNYSFLQFTTIEGCRFLLSDQRLFGPNECVGLCDCDVEQVGDGLRGGQCKPLGSAEVDKSFSLEDFDEDQRFSW